MIGTGMSDIYTLLGVSVIGFIGGEVLKSTGHQRLGWTLDMVIFGIGITIGLKWLKKGVETITEATHWFS